jgi:hypothetical protein
MRGWLDSVLRQVRACVLGDIEARTAAALNAHDELFDTCAERLTDLEARMSEWDVEGKGAKAA